MIRERLIVPAPWKLSEVERVATKAPSTIEGTKLGAGLPRTAVRHLIPMTGTAACGRTPLTHHEPDRPRGGLSASHSCFEGAKP